MNRLKAVIYARVSTEEQAKEGYSIKAQKQLLRDYATHRNFEIVGEYIDEGRSAKSIDGRPEMQRLLKDAKEKKFNSVIIYKLDRLARKTKDSLEIAETLERYNVQLMSYSENIDTTTPGGKMFFTVLSSVAEMERATIIDRVKMGMNQRAKQGKWNGGIVLGYDVIDKELIVNEEEASIVQEIFTLASKGYGYKKIAYDLNKLGYKTKKKKEFSVNSIKGILDNPMYIGKIRFNQHENWSEKRRQGKNSNPDLVNGTHKPIIQEDLWNLVQEKRKKRSFRPAQSGNPYFLGRLLRCPVCGYGMVAAKARGENGAVYRLYQCGQYKNKGRTVCQANTINADKAEKYVVDELKRVVMEPYFIEKLVNRMNSDRSDAERPLQEERKRLLSNKQKNEKYIDNLVTMLMDDPDLRDIYNNKLKEQKQQLISITERIQSLDSQLKNVNKEPIDAESLKYLLQNLDTILERADAAEKKELLALFIKDIQITKDKVSGKIGRQILAINLMFDFTIEALQGSTGALMNQMCEINCIAPVDLSFMNNPSYNENSMREALASLNLLPLFMIRFPPINPKRPINLLQQDKLHQLMRKRHLRKRKLIIRPLQNLLAQSKRPANDKCNFAFPIRS
ncbi:recombinase family protein [Cytobacillus oceanisediminis]|nr:recombinase family protein [Cytobacillus oceanisediminis]